MSDKSLFLQFYGGSCFRLVLDRSGIHQVSVRNLGLAFCSYYAFTDSNPPWTKTRRLAA